MNEETEQEFRALQDACEIVKKSAFTPLENMSIDKSITILINNLKETLRLLFPEASIQEELEYISQEIRNLEISDHTIEDYKFSLRQSSIEKKERAKNAFILACIYTSLAQTAFGDDRLFIAWRAISQAERYLGQSDGLIDFLTIPITERAKKGGNKKSDNARYANQKIIDLLIELKPTKGWRNPSHAANAIVDPLLKKIKEESLSLTQDRNDLIQILLNLIIDDEEVAAAYEPAE